MKDYDDPRIERLSAEAHEDFILSDMNLKEQALAAPNVKLKWIRTLSAEQKLLSALSEKLEEYKTKLIEAQFGKMEVPQFKKELDISKDLGIKKINTAIASQKDLIRFIEGIVRICNGYGFDIKNCVDMVKLENQ